MSISHDKQGPRFESCWVLHFLRGLSTSARASKSGHDFMQNFAFENILSAAGESFFARNSRVQKFILREFKETAVLEQFERFVFSILVCWMSAIDGAMELRVKYL